ncbi:MAG: S-layer homology domain-containing protein [Oscillospiraceae bacterium]|nr:S-layer homology domain-containing protein [Oscillospiraceae bacterium]
MKKKIVPWLLSLCLIVSVLQTAASAAENGDSPDSKFSDVNKDDWYFEAAEYAASHSLMPGVSGDVFRPCETVSRGAAVQALYLLDGAEYSGVTPFMDVEDGSDYQNAVGWAAENGLINGCGGGRFCPEDPVTREQVAVIIYRYAQSLGKGFTGTWMFLLDYCDRDSISEGAYESVAWLTVNGIFSGKDDNSFDPGGIVTRAQLATVLMRFDRAFGKESFFFGFDKSGDGFRALFADYHDDGLDYESYQMKSEYAEAPVEGAQSKSLYIRSINRSDDMFILKPNTGYLFNISFQLATNVTEDAFGIGGSPSDSVYVKAGVLSVEPKFEKDATGVLRFCNIDIGRQSQSGKDAVVVGDMARQDGKSDNSFVWKEFSARISAVSDANGCIFLLIGTDSGFEGLTEYYLDGISVVCR